MVSRLFPTRQAMAKRSIPGIRAIVTGVSSGIGRELVLQLTQQGAHVVGIARRAERLEALAESCASMPGKFHYVAGDVTDAAVRAAALAKAKEAYGGLDLLINNAGIGAMGPFDTADPARLRRVFEVNFFAPLEFIREALPELKAGRQPMVVNVASTLGHVGLPKLSEYSASKFALRGFSDAFRAEQAHNGGVDVLVISPATTATEIFDVMIEAKGDTPWRQRKPPSAATVAGRIIKAIRKNKKEIFASFAAWFITWSNRNYPWLIRWILARRQ